MIGLRTRVWHWTQIGDGAQIGDDCIVGSAVYVDRGVTIGNKVKIQTGAQLYRGAVVEDGVFIGPQACLTNDRYPRAVTPDGELKSDADWDQGRTLVRYGASIGAGAVVLTNVTVGTFAVIGAGAIVVADVPDHALVVGAPARVVGFVCACGHRLIEPDVAVSSYWECQACGAGYLRPTSNEPWIKREVPVAYHAW